MTKWQRFLVFVSNGFNAPARYCDEPDFLILQWLGRSGRICPTRGLVSQGIAESTGLSTSDNPDSWSGILMSGAAGAAATGVALILMVYFRSRYRTVSDIARHGLAAVVVLGLLAFVGYDLRDAALAYLGMNPAKPGVEFEIRQPKAAATAVADTQIELHTLWNHWLTRFRG